LNNGKEYYSEPCRSRAEKYFNKNNQYLEHLHLYTEILG